MDVVFLAVIGLVMLVVAWSVVGLTAQWRADCTITVPVSELANVSAVNSVSQAAQLVCDQFNKTGTLNAGSSAPATKFAQFEFPLSAGAGTINLAALTGLNGAVIDGTGLKLQLLLIENLGANSMTFSEGASNGYAIGSEIVVRPGGVSFDFFNEGLPDIASGDRTIDVAGTGSQTAKITVVMG